MFLVGIPFYACYIQLPQRFQAVNHTTAERAGILLLPVSLLTPVGAMITGLLIGKVIAAEYILIISAAIICIGIGLLSSIPTHPAFWVGTYGYEVITGLGLGLVSPPYYYLLATSVGENDVAVGTGALNMWRTLGGTVGVAICSAVHNSILENKLPTFLTAEQIALVKESNAYARTLSLEAQKRLGEVSGQSYNSQFHVILAFSCLNLLVTIGLAVLRKKKGILGVVLERKGGNEFTRTTAAKEMNEADKNVNAAAAVDTLTQKEIGNGGTMISVEK